MRLHQPGLDGNVLSRKDLYGAVAEATRTGTVAFEADELDDGLRSGWSVSVSQVTDDVP